MRDNWITNYKRHWYQFDIDENNRFLICVTSDEMKFHLKLQKGDNLIYITKSNNMQILKDLVYAFENHVNILHIIQSFHTLKFYNLQSIIQILYETKNHLQEANC